MSPPSWPAPPPYFPPPHDTITPPPPSFNVTTPPISAPPPSPSPTQPPTMPSLPPSSTSPSPQPENPPPPPPPPLLPINPPSPPTIPISYSPTHSPPSPISPPPPPLSPPPPSFVPITLSPPPQPMQIPVTFASPPPPSSSTSNIHIGITIGISIGVTGSFLLLVVLILLCCYRNRKNRSTTLKDNVYGALPQHLKQKIWAPGEPRVMPMLPKHYLLPPCIHSSGNSGSVVNSESENHFSLQAHGMAFDFSGGNFTIEELALATNGFSEANLLGEGGFGYVHKGILQNGMDIAVKQLKMGSRQGQREFQAEIETISRVHHKHLVSLVGYCIIGPERLLVYEFVPNNTLEFHLHGKEQQPTMEWATRLKIAIGSAKGLAYLHEDCNPTIIHRDIKVANILIDSNFEAKVSDFGLAKFFSDANQCITHVSTRVVGTFGYLAPEYALSGKASYKSDVFSYGVVLLEIITGRRSIYTTESSISNSLVSWARPLLKRAMEDGNYDTLADPRLQKNYKNEEMSRMIACAAACVRHSAWRRPHMSQIVHALEGGSGPIDVNEGIRPGCSTVCSYSNDAEHIKAMNQFFLNMMNEENHIDSSSNNNTSECGLYPSGGSSFDSKKIT